MQSCNSRQGVRGNLDFVAVVVSFVPSRAIIIVIVIVTN